MWQLMLFSSPFAQREEKPKFRETVKDMSSGLLSRFSSYIGLKSSKQQQQKDQEQSESSKKEGGAKRKGEKADSSKMEEDSDDDDEDTDGEDEEWDMLEDGGEATSSIVLGREAR